MPLVRVNLAPVISSIASSLPTGGDANRVLKGLGAVAMNEWKRLAISNLRSSSRDYVAGIDYREHNDKVVISLAGRVPNMIEQGWSGGDMRTWLLSGPKARTAKDGSRYATVPFRHGTPGTGGRNVGREMPKPIHNAAKKLMPTLSRPTSPTGARGATQYGGRLKPHARMRKATRDILERKEKPWHATSVYMGMIREQKTYGKATQSQYMTFRRISSKVKRGEKHWVHPGITPRHFAKQVQSYVEGMASSIIAGAMR
ncbi:hypothetical protein K0U83_26880 [bacterium]|nr:hypothetical protein [bacterium]